MVSMYHGDNKRENLVRIWITYREKTDNKDIESYHILKPISPLSSKGRYSGALSHKKAGKFCALMETVGYSGNNYLPIEFNNLNFAFNIVNLGGFK